MKSYSDDLIGAFRKTGLKRPAADERLFCRVLPEIMRQCGRAYLKLRDMFGGRGTGCTALLMTVL